MDKPEYQLATTLKYWTREEQIKYLEERDSMYYCTTTQLVVWALIIFGMGIGVGRII